MTSPQVGFVFLDQIERGLVLALAMSRQKHEWPADWPGAPATELADLLHKLSGFSGPQSLLRARPQEFGRFRDGVVLAVGQWAGTPDHFQRRHELIALLIEMREAVLEDMRSLPEAAEQLPIGSGPKDAHWQRTSKGLVEVRFGGLVRTITDERNSWIFAEVARARGVLVTWSDLLRRRMELLGTVESLSEKTLERYGRDLRRDLDPLGDLWEQNATGARWRGGDELRI